MADERITAEMLLRMIADTHSVVEGIAEVTGTLDDMDEGVERNRKGLGTLGVAFGNLLARIGYNVLQVPVRAFALLNQKVKEFVQFAKSATMVAARIEVQWRTLALTAGNAGENIKDMAGHVNALRSYGIKTGEALEAVTQFLSTGLPVENITELARRAQDMAVVIGSDSTEAFSRFNWFLQTGNSQLLRTMGIMKTATQMFKEYAKAQGLVVAALTDRQRKEALVQGLMKATIAYEGAYEEAMKDPYKRWTSLPRLISNATEVLGHMFVPLLGTAVDLASDLLEKFEGIFRVTKKGAFRLMAQEMGLESVEDLTGEDKARAIGKFFGQWTEFAYNMRATVEIVAEGITEVFQNLIGEAWGWGEGLGTNLTQGLINAAQNVILPALVQITGWIASFLAPGSDPERGPLSTISTWGIDLMKTYMKGWAKIDFQVFNQVAGTIQSAIQAAFTAAGKGKKGGLALQEALLEGRRLAAQVVSQLGAGTAGIAGLLGGAAGPLQADLMKYIGLIQRYKAAILGVTAAREQLARAEAWVAQATRAVNAARKKAEEIERWVAEATKKVSDLRDALQKKELEWAEVPERFVRGRKRQLQLEILAAEEETKRRNEVLDVAQRQVELAQEEERYRREALVAVRQQLVAAQEHARLIQEAMSLQQARLQELAKQMQMEADIAAKKAAEAAAEVEDIEKIKNAWEGVFDPALLEEAKERMRGLLAPLMPQIQEIGGNLRAIWEDLPGKIEAFKTALLGVWDVLMGWWAKLLEIRAWFDGLPEWIQNILKGWGITIALNWITGGAIGKAIFGIWASAITLGPAGALILAITALVTMVLLNKEELAKWFDPTAEVEESRGAQAIIVGIQKLFEWSPLNWITGGRWGEWANKNIVYPITEGLIGSEDDIRASTQTGITGPMEDEFDRSAQRIVEHSIVPDMVNRVIDWLRNMADDVVTPMDAFVENTVTPFETVTQSWLGNIDTLMERFDSLIGRVRLLTTGIQGLPPLPEDLALFAEGQLQLVTVNLQGSTFGAGITRGDIDDWMHGALGDLME